MMTRSFLRSGTAKVYGLTVTLLLLPYMKYLKQQSDAK